MEHPGIPGVIAVRESDRRVVLTTSKTEWQVSYCALTEAEFQRWKSSGGRIV